ncbi:MAG: enoyl-CoA hydratase [Burkholderiaceae bacterium]
MTIKEYADGKILGGREGKIGRLIINNPERHNATSLAMWKGAFEVVDSLANDPETRMLVVSGNGGKAFASGADISKFEQERSDPNDVDHYQSSTARFYEALYNFPKPTVAKINGYCIGGGMALAVCCDMRICQEKSRFGVPAAKLALGYPYEGVERLANVVGTSMAAEIFYTARQFSSTEAYEMGLVNRVVPDDELDAFVDDYAERISGNAPLTIAAIKQIKLAINAVPTERDHEMLNSMVKACFDSKDYIEGRRAFMEKRKPDFKGS